MKKLELKVLSSEQKRVDAILFEAQRLLKAGSFYSKAQKTEVVRSLSSVASALSNRIQDELRGNKTLSADFYDEQFSCYEMTSVPKIISGLGVFLWGAPKSPNLQPFVDYATDLEQVLKLYESLKAMDVEKKEPKKLSIKPMDQWDGHGLKAAETLRQMGTDVFEWEKTPFIVKESTTKRKVMIECETCRGKGVIREKGEQKLCAMKCQAVVGELSVFYTPRGVNKNGTALYSKNKGSKRYPVYCVEKTVIVYERWKEADWKAKPVFQSRFAGGGTSLHSQCQLCAKAIPSGRMVPFQLKTTRQDGNVLALLVGEDCAQKFLAEKPVKRLPGEEFRYGNEGQD